MGMNMFKDRKKRQKSDFPEAAYEWLALLEAGDITPEEFESYLEWRDSDPCHVKAMEELQKEWREICKVPVPQPRAWSGVRHSQNNSKGRNWGFAGFIAQLQSRAIYRAGMALALIGIIVGAGLYQYISSVTEIEKTRVYSSARAEMKTITLDDGSTVHLNAQSRITVNYTGNERNITLEQGEALFEVSHNPVRPFLVYAGNGKVQAIGTQFNVKLMPDFNVMVTLVEGVIRITQNMGKHEGLARILKIPGEMASLRPFPDTDKDMAQENLPEIKITQHSSDPFQDVLSWREGKLVFQGQRLDNVLYEINRHSNHRILLKSKKAIDMPVYAVFNAGDWRGALSAIVKSYPVKAVQVSNDETHLVAEDE